MTLVFNIYRCFTKLHGSHCVLGTVRDNFDINMINDNAYFQFNAF